MLQHVAPRSSRKSPASTHRPAHGRPLPRGRQCAPIANASARGSAFCCWRGCPSPLRPPPSVATRRAYALWLVLGELRLAPLVPPRQDQSRGCACLGGGAVAEAGSAWLLRRGGAARKHRCLRELAAEPSLRCRASSPPGPAAGLGSSGRVWSIPPEPLSGLLGRPRCGCIACRPRASSIIRPPLLPPIPRNRSRPAALRP